MTTRVDLTDVPTADLEAELSRRRPVGRDFLAEVKANAEALTHGCAIMPSLWRIATQARADTDWLEKYLA